MLWPLLLALPGCGALTGIPGHGGGKRFAVEQELVAAATRAALLQIDLARIQGRKVNLCVNAIGDVGSGNLAGGRFSIVSQLRGDYLQTAPITETSVYPRYKATTDTIASSGSTTTTQAVETLLNAPSSKRTQQQGTAAVVQAGAEYAGMGAYHNSEEITSNDLQYLFALLQTYCFLKGVSVAPPSEAELDVYITVDVFGTVYTRVDWLLANNEVLRAKTSLEVLAVDHWTGELVMPPQAVTAEAEYNEQYVLWAGPVKIKKTLRQAEPLLCDFTHLQEKNTELVPVIRNEKALAPFQ
nr:hypothetical protein [uncultured Desulfobulbus sp.]